MIIAVFGWHVDSSEHCNLSGSACSWQDIIAMNECRCGWRSIRMLLLLLYAHNAGRSLIARSGANVITDDSSVCACVASSLLFASRANLQHKYLTVLLTVKNVGHQRHCRLIYKSRLCCLPLYQLSWTLSQLSGRSLATPRCFEQFWKA